MTHSKRRPRGGFTLVELMVAIFVSLILMGIGGYIYNACLRLYREGQGTMEVYETSKLLERDLRDFLKNTVPVPGAWVAPKCMNFQGVTNANSKNLDTYYLQAQAWAPSKAVLMTNNALYDKWFSGPEYAVQGTEYNMGYVRCNNGSYPYGYATASWNDAYHGTKGWWMPAFFGKRDGTKTPVLNAQDITAGAWGWPRADYRLDASADDLAGHATVACWFYAENRGTRSPYTLTLDNANIVLCSLKFFYKAPDPKTGDKEQTGLLFLRHQIVGFDTANGESVKDEMTYSNMLRAVSIKPYTFDKGGALVPMDDKALGADATGKPLPTGPGVGLGTPRCFNVNFTLRNAVTYQPLKFAFNVYVQTTPQ